MNNPRVKIKRTELLSDNWSILNKVTYDYQKPNGTGETYVREAYDRGNGAAILLYNRERRTVILTRQFRLPTYVIRPGLRHDRFGRDSERQNDPALATR